MRYTSRVKNKHSGFTGSVINGYHIKMPQKQPEMRAWEPSPLEKQKYAIEDKLRGVGGWAQKHNIPLLRALDDPSYTRGVAKDLSLIGEMIPGPGDIQALREGYHLATEGENPEAGLILMGLGAIPLLPTTPFIPIAKEAAKRGLKVTPTQLQRQPTDMDSSSASTYSLDSLGRTPDVSRINIETLAERQLLSNPKYPDPNELYNVKELVESTINRMPTAARAGLKRQLDEWVSPVLMRSKATLQEVLDDIGRNKPRIREQYDLESNPEFFNAYATRHMPGLPTSEPALDASRAAKTLMPLRYSERNLSVHSPKYRQLGHSAGTGHTEVGTGVLKDLKGADRNEINRIFTNRSGLYDIDGKKVLVAGEGQSGIYEMGTSVAKAKERINRGEMPEFLTDYVEHDIGYRLSMGEDMAERADEVVNYLKPGKTLDEWNSLARQQQKELQANVQDVYRRNNTTPAEHRELSDQSLAYDTQFRNEIDPEGLAQGETIGIHNTQIQEKILAQPGMQKEAKISHELGLLYPDTATKYSRKFEELLGKGGRDRKSVV